MTRVRLSDFTALETIVWDSKPGVPSDAVVDTSLDQVLVATSGVSSQILRLRVPEFVWSGVLALGEGENRASPRGRFLWRVRIFRDLYEPRNHREGRLSDFKRVAALTLEPGEDASRRPRSTPREATRISAPTRTQESGQGRLSDFMRVGATTLRAGESRLSAATIDAPAGYAYFGTYTSPGLS